MLKQLVRDIIQPDRDLGHSDRKGHKAKNETDTSNEEIDKPLKEVAKQDAQIEQGKTVETDQALDKDCVDCQ